VMSFNRRGIARGLAAAALGVTFGALSGCNYIGAAYVLVKGPEKTPAAHTLEKDRPTVIFVDDRANVLARRSLRTQIAKSAQDTLLKEGVLTNVIDTSAAMQVAQREAAGEPLAISELGKAVQAEVVVYVVVDSFTLSTDGQTFTPTAKAHVKVIDVTSRARTWPEKKEGHPVNVTLKLASGDVPKTTTQQLKALDALAEKTGVEIAEVFYDSLTHESIRQGH